MPDNPFRDVFSLPLPLSVATLFFAFRRKYVLMSVGVGHILPVVSTVSKTTTTTKNMALFSFIARASVFGVVAVISAWLFITYVVKINNAVCFGAFEKGWHRPFAELQNVAYVFDGSYRLTSRTTQYQTVEVYWHDFFGNILVIDDSLQITQRDEANYHEMMVHVPMVYMLPPTKVRRQIGHLADASPLKVAIIGGGDGGALSRVLLYPFVEKAYLVDIDLEVMRDVTLEYFPHLYVGYEDPRTVAVQADGNEWVKDMLATPANLGSLGLVIVDSTDYGSAEPLFTDDFYISVKKLLDPKKGILLVNLDSPSWNADVVVDVQRRLGEIFTYSFVYQSVQPSFLGGHYSYLLLSDVVHPMKSPINWDSFEHLDISNSYYNPDLHFGAFMLPESVRRLLSMHGRVNDIASESIYDGEYAAEETHAVQFPVDRLGDDL